MSSTPTPNSSARLRRAHTKTKSGCDTCKQRRVKCDETRPFCMKCVSTGRECKGYHPPKAWLFSFVHENEPGDNTSSTDRARSVTPVRPPHGAQVDAELSRFNTEVVHRERLITTFLNYFLSENSAVSSRLKFSSWPSMACKLAGVPRYDFLTTALIALSLCMLSRRKSDKEVLSHSIVMYHHSLQKLRKAISRLSHQQSDNLVKAVIAACFSCAYVEHLLGSWSSSIHHLQGIATLLSYSGPEALEDDSMRRLYHDYRELGIFSCYFDKPVPLLMAGDWAEAAKASNHPTEKTLKSRLWTIASRAYMFIDSNRDILTGPPPDMPTLRTLFEQSSKCLLAYNNWREDDDLPSESAQTARTQENKEELQESPLEVLLMLCLHSAYIMQLELFRAELSQKIDRTSAAAARAQIMKEIQVNTAKHLSLVKATLVVSLAPSHGLEGLSSVVFCLHTCQKVASRFNIQDEGTIRWLNQVQSLVDAKGWQMPEAVDTEHEAQGDLSEPARPQLTRGTSNTSITTAPNQGTQSSCLGICGLDSVCTVQRVKIAPFNIPDPASLSHIPPASGATAQQARVQQSSAHDEEKDSRGEESDTASDLDIQSDDLSLWSDAADIGDAYADVNEDDPLTVELAELDTRGHHKSTNKTKRARGKNSTEGDKEKSVHFDHSTYSDTAPLVSTSNALASITPPTPTRPRQIPVAEKLLALIMGPSDPHLARTRGLVGQPLLYFTSVFVSLGVFLFGYDQGVMSGIITGPFFKDYFNQPSRAEIGTMVAILEIGAFVSSLLVGRIGDIIGRRRTILYGSMIFFVGGAMQTLANGMPMMLLGRIIAGLGVGALSTIVPVYQSEISPPHNRGKLACIEFTGNISGYAASVWTDYFCSYISSDYAWRVPLGMQCVMGALLGFGSLIICESPRWLLDNDHDEQGMVVIANLYGEGDLMNEKARQEYREIKMNVLIQRQEGERSYSDMFRRYRKRVFIAMSAQAFAQLNGINVISYYAPLVFESAGWLERQAILMTGINSFFYLASSIPPWYLVDKWGRRPILLSGAVSMVIALSMISYFLYIDIRLTPKLVVVFVVIYNAAFGASWGPIPWLYPPEILPLSIRAKGASLSTASNWAFNWLVGEMTPILQEAIKWRLYLLHAFFCAVSFVLVYFVYPETANVRLEDMNALFGDATTAMPTPATVAERGSLMGVDSPASLRRGAPRGPGIFSTDDAIPGLDIDPPEIDREGEAGGTRQKSQGREEKREGLGGWISSMVSRTTARGRDKSSKGDYGRVQQEDD